MKNQESICSLKGIGDKTAKLFEKLGIHTIEELIHDYPRAYQAYDPPVSIGEVEESQIQAVAGFVQRYGSVRRFQRIQVITVSLKDQTGSVQLTWYNMPFLRNTLQSGTYHIFYGKVTRKNNRLTMEQPEIYTRETYAQVAESMQPVYGQTKGLSNKTISKAVAQALDLRDMERDYLPAELRRKHELAEYNFAVEHIHFPANRQELLFARKRLVFDEFFLFLTGVRKLKEKREDMHSHWVMKLAPEVKKLKDHLPYRLTDAQEKVLNEVEWDLGSGLVMNRLIQGDVGSGKTIIAILALLHAAYARRARNDPDHRTAGRTAAADRPARRRTAGTHGQAHAHLARDRAVQERAQYADPASQALRRNPQQTRCTGRRAGYQPRIRQDTAASHPRRVRPRTGQGHQRLTRSPTGGNPSAAEDVPTQKQPVGKRGGAGFVRTMPRRENAE